MFIADLFVIDPKRKQLKCPSIGEWVDCEPHSQDEIPLSNKKNTINTHQKIILLSKKIQS